MFDIGFSELVLIFIVGLVVLGPQRLPVAIRTVVSWIRTIRGIATNVQNELSQELKLHELQESIKKAEKLNLSELSPDLAKNIQDLKEIDQSNIEKSFTQVLLEVSNIAMKRKVHLEQLLNDRIEDLIEEYEGDSHKRVVNEGNVDK